MRIVAIGAGAVAALLGLAAPAAAQQTSTFVAANLMGEDVAGGKGDNGASANLNGEIDLRRNRLCYYLDMDGLNGADAAHLHRSDQAGTDAPILALKLPGPDGDEVCVDADKAVLEAFAREPGQYYIDVHTPGHPDGAARGKIK